MLCNDLAEEYSNKKDKQNTCPYGPYIPVSETDDKLVKKEVTSSDMISSLKKTSVFKITVQACQNAVLFVLFPHFGPITFNLFIFICCFCVALNCV